MEEDFELGPAEHYRPFEECEDMYFKLVMLNYEDQFLRISRLPALHRHYFVVPTNSGEQYYNFVLLAAWLIQKCGKKIEYPQESDDPNTVISNILGIMRDMGGVVDFSPSKVKSGCGQEVVHVLTFFADKAVSDAGIEFKKVEISDDRGEDEDEEAGEADSAFQEVDLEKIEEEMQQYYTSDDDEAGEGEGDGAWVPGAAPKDRQDPPQERLKVLESNTDVEEWRLELERVLPQLKVTVKPDTQDWRWRYEQMENYAKSIADASTQLEAPLEKLMTDAKIATDKIQSRENFLSSQVQDLLVDYSALEAKVNKARNAHREQGLELGNRNRELAQLSDDVEDARRQLDDRGTVMADGAPVSQVRKALASLKKEMADMEVEIGVLDHCVLKSLIQEQTVLRDKSNQ